MCANDVPKTNPPFITTSSKDGRRGRALEQNVPYSSDLLALQPSIQRSQEQTPTSIQRARASTIWLDWSLGLGFKRNLWRFTRGIYAFRRVVV